MMLVLKITYFYPANATNFNNLQVFITDHSADTAIGTDKYLKDIYSKAKLSCFEWIRADWRWSKIEPTRGKIDTVALERYTRSYRIMQQVGLEPPRIIFSSLPTWAEKLYESDFEQFKSAFRNYVSVVEKTLSPDYKIESVQVLNEINTGLFSTIRNVDDINDLADITRQVFKKHNPGIKIVASFLAGNLSEGHLNFDRLPELERYLKSHFQNNKAFDILSIDYYPGMWHRPADLGLISSNHEEIFGHLEPLERIFRLLESWNKTYEVGETGYPSMSWLTLQAASLSKGNTTML